MTIKEKIFNGFLILFLSVVLNFFVTKSIISKTGQKEEFKALLTATDSIFTSLEYLNRISPKGIDPKIETEIVEEIEKVRSALRSRVLLEIRLESYQK